MELPLIHHGRQYSKLYNMDVDLGEEGYKQVSLLGEHLSREDIQAAYSSNLLRAMKTAQAVNLYWNVEHIIRPELREISFGRMKGMDDRDIAVKYRGLKAWQAPMEEDLPHPGGECVGDMVRRAQLVFREMTEGGYEHVAVMTREGVIHSMTAHYLGIPMNRWRTLGKSLESCSITELNWSGASGCFTLKCSNDYAHLGPHPELL